MHVRPPVLHLYLSLSVVRTLLELLDRRRVQGIFATHLHELLHLPLMLDTVQCMRMGYETETVASSDGDAAAACDPARDDLGLLDAIPDVRWTFQLLPGSDTDSKVLPPRWRPPTPWADRSLY